MIDVPGGSSGLGSDDRRLRGDGGWLSCDYTEAVGLGEE